MRLLVRLMIIMSDALHLMLPTSVPHQRHCWCCHITYTGPALCTTCDFVNRRCCGKQTSAGCVA